MAICRGCSAETTRVRTTYHTDKLTGKVASETDECPSCAPGSFEPRWLQERGVAAWEAYPTKYKKKYLPDGRVGYFATDEWRADTEAKIVGPASDEEKRYRQALAERRARRRTKPLSKIELEQAMERACRKMK